MLLPLILSLKSILAKWSHNLLSVNLFCDKYVGGGYLKILKQVWCLAVVFQNQTEMSIR